MGWKLTLIALLFLAGCSTPKVERIEESPSNQEEAPIQEEVKMPKLKFEDIPTTPQEQVIDLQ